MKKRELGTWITLSEPSITEIVTEFEFDWICIDLEHSVIDYNQMQILISIIQNKNKKPMSGLEKIMPLLLKEL